VQIWNALELAYCKTNVLDLKQKLDFECIGAGKNLSFGLRQLICLARALVKKSKILILDEANSTIDSQTSKLIQSAIRKEFAECIAVKVAHDLETTDDCSRFVV
jgi:ATP-binding cassette subfamily C (CFTR/MRP) protein 1